MLAAAAFAVGNPAAAQGALAERTPPASPLAWTSAWMAAPDSPGPPLPAQTMRQTVRPALGGEALRVRISNEYGDRPLQIDAAAVALAAAAAQIVPGSSRALTVGGDSRFAIAPGQAVVTDPVPLKLVARQALSVSLFFAQGTGASTIHSTGMQNAYTHLRDNAAHAVTLAEDEKDDSRYFVTDIEVLADARSQVVVAVGDSTTDGVGTDLDSDTRWTDQLAARLQQDPALQHVAIVNAGLSGNRILSDAKDPFLGPSTLKRFERDALSKPGVKWIVLLQGINDITASSMFADDATQRVTAAQLIDGMQQLVRRAHARGIRVMGATLLPRQGAQGARRHTPAGEALRQQVNAWVREGGAFDAVVDFDRVLRDPARPDRQRTELNSGDFSHPNAAGYGAMARAIDLEQFKR